MRKILFTFCLFIFGSASIFVGQTPVVNLNVFSTGFDTPVAIENCGDDRLFVVQQEGLIRILRSGGSVDATPFLNLTSRVSPVGTSERGLLGLAFDPDYLTNGVFYVNYTRAGDHRTVIARYHVSANPDSADFNSEEIVKVIYQPYSNHNGGWLGFGPDGYLYIGMGDGGSSNDPGSRAQHPDSLLGKILRIDVNNTSTYSIPPSNPYAGGTSPAPEIWARGIRNPWKPTFDKFTGDFYIADVGQGAWEEVDFEPAGFAGGANYGWRCREGLVANPFNPSGCTGPVVYDDPVHVYSSAGTSCSITGGTVYRGVQEGDLHGFYVYIDLCSGMMGGLQRQTNGSWFFDTLGVFPYGASGYRWSSIGQNNAGELFLGNFDNGNIYSLATNNCAPYAGIFGDTLICLSPGDSLEAMSASGFLHQWFLNGSLISGATGTSYIPLATGYYSVSTENSGGCLDTSAVVHVILVTPSAVTISGLGSVYCNAEPAVTLTGNPIGGTFSGTGMSGASFNPTNAMQGNNIVTYTVTDANGCVFSANDTTLVGGHEALTITSILPSDSTYCTTDPLDTLAGNPAGGTFTGLGMTGNVFNPSAFVPPATAPITYIFTDAANCTNTKTINMQIDVCTGLNGNRNRQIWKLFPNPANDKMHLISSNGGMLQGTITLTDSQGKKWMSIEGRDAAEINVMELPAGLYFLVGDGIALRFSVIR